MAEIGISTSWPSGLVSSSASFGVGGTPPRGLEWIAATGEVLPFDGTQGVWAGMDVSVAGLPQPNAATISVPFRDGNVVTNVKYEAREPVVPFIIDGRGGFDFEQIITRLARLLDPTRGPGWLRVTRHDGTQRIISARYKQGLQVVEALNTTEVWDGALMFEAADPWWMDGRPFQHDFLFRAGNPQTWFTIFPLVLGATEALQGSTLVNVGDGVGYPIWTVTGPGSNLVITNKTTGQSLSLAMSIGAGAQVIIDTGTARVTGPNGENLIPLLSADSDLWAVGQGTAEVEISMTGLTSQSQVNVIFPQRWLSA